MTMMYRFAAESSNTQKKLHLFMHELDQSQLKVGMLNHCYRNISYCCS